MCRVVFLAVLSVLLGAVYASVTEREPLARAGETVVVVDCVLQGKGSFRVNVVPEWAPLGAERFLDLVRDGFFDGTALFRAVKGFLVQFGIAKESELNQKWSHRIMKDDPKVGVRIRRGTLAFAGSGVNSRATQMFVALSDHSWPHLGKEPWETPFGYIDKSDMERVWGQVNTEYGDMKPWGKRGVDVGKLWAQGYSYLEENFPGMDYITFCKIVQDSSSDEEDPKFVEEDVEDDGSVAQFEKIALRKINDVSSTCPYCLPALVFLLTLVLLTLVCRRVWFRTNLKQA